MRITSKGQVTIPQAVREAAGLMPGSDVEFVVEGDQVRLVKATGRSPGRRPTRGERLVAQLSGTATTPYTTDELLELLRGSWDEEPPGVLD